MKKTKIDIIAGFLGAGKTTFIKKLMQDLVGEEKVVILENEFGKINIDKETLGREGIIVKSIQARCICCTGSGDLANGILEIIQEYEPDRIMIEPTGVAKLSEVKRILQMQDIAELCELDHIVTIVDAKNYYIRTLISKEFFEDQIRSSEVIFLSKTDQMDVQKVNDVKEDIHKVQPRCLIVTDTWDKIGSDQLKILIDYKQDVLVVKQPIRLIKNHRNDYESYEIVLEESLNINLIKLFIEEIDKGIYGEIDRLKGISKDDIQGWYSVESVPGETIILPLASEKVLLEKSQICIIGRQLETNKLNERFKT